MSGGCWGCLAANAAAALNFASALPATADFCCCCSGVDGAQGTCGCGLVGDLLVGDADPCCCCLASFPALSANDLNFAMAFLAAADGGGVDGLLFAGDGGLFVSLLLLLFFALSAAAFNLAMALDAAGFEVVALLDSFCGDAGIADTGLVF